MNINFESICQVLLFKKCLSITVLLRIALNLWITFEETIYFNVKSQTWYIFNLFGCSYTLKKELYMGLEISGAASCGIVLIGD